MKTIKINYMLSVRQLGGLFAGLLLLLLLQVPGISHAQEKRETAVQGDDALTYMMETDALKLNGTVSKMREWNPRDDSWLTGDYFEPVVITIAVKNRGGECFGAHDFYLKKGIDLSGLEQGDVLQFSINKNMCHPNKALIIMNLNVVQSKGRR